MEYCSLYIYIHMYNRLCDLVGRAFANVPGDLGSIPGHVILKTLKMVLDTSLLNTQHYKVHIKGKVEQSRERSIALPLHLGVVSIEKGAFWSPSTTVTNFTYLYIYIYIYICVCVCVCVLKTIMDCNPTVYIEKLITRQSRLEGNIYWETRSPL